MTTYTSIPNSDIDQDSPVTQPLMTALRDNPIAITEGATGAPRIVAAGIEGGDVSAAGEVYYSEGDGTGLWGNAENIEATKDVTGTDGYVKLPGGIILQWGEVSVNGNSTATITWPLAFPNACIQAVISHGYDGSTGSDSLAAIYNLATTSAIARNGTNNTSTMRYFAIGY